MTEEQIIAYVDGELSPIEALRFQRAVEADPALASDVDRHRRLRARIASHFAPVSEEPLPEKLTAFLEPAGKVVAFPARQQGRFSQGGRYAALAATLVAGLLIGQLLPFGPLAPIGEKNGAVVAQGDLARTLDVQLASAPQAGAYRIGVSFRGGDSRYCRTFTGEPGVGLACRGDGGWTIERFIAGAAPGTGGTYRQAGSASGEILAAAQEMMKGEPLNAAEEQAARARGWR